MVHRVAPEGHPRVAHLARHVPGHPHAFGLARPRAPAAAAVRRRVEERLALVGRQPLVALDRLAPCAYPGQLVPPAQARPIEEAGGEEEGGGHPRRAQDREGEIEVVAIAVVEGDEHAAPAPCAEGRGHLVERDDVAGRCEMGHLALELVGRGAEQVAVEHGGAGLADAVVVEDEQAPPGTGPPQHRAEP